MAAPLSQQELAAKVQQYEAFLNDRLKTDLTAAQTRKAKITLELKEYEDLERSLQEIKQVRTATRGRQGQRGRGTASSTALYPLPGFAWRVAGRLPASDTLHGHR